MVSFQCDECGDVVTRKKIDSHQRRCYNAAITCIDCHATFYGNDHKSHTSCITEAQKYEGALYKGKKAKQQHQRQTPKTPLNSTYQKPSVEDENTSSPSSWQVSKVEVPPPAPTPPQTVAEPPPNVFDFLVQERSPPQRPPRRSGAGSSGLRTPTTRGNTASSASSVTSSRPASNAAPLQDDGIVYGGGPIPRGYEKFESDLTIMEVDGQAVAALQTSRTPAARQLADVERSAALLKQEGSDKKRKRVEELESSRHNSAGASDAAPPLHSGLTGGLAKLLGRSESKKVDASPLSPKKRSKATSNGDTGAARYEERRPRHKREEVTSKIRDERESDRHRKHKKHHYHDDEDSKHLKAIEYPSQNGDLAIIRTSSSLRTPSTYSSHSELFISLVDKPHSSQKGQSIWGTLKTFHESIMGRSASDMNSYYDDSSTGSSQKENEEKRLMKALRMKVNKYGEVVLFARPDFEVAEEDDVVNVGDRGGGGSKRQKQIEAA